MRKLFHKLKFTTESSTIITPRAQGVNTLAILTPYVLNGTMTEEEADWVAHEMGPECPPATMKEHLFMIEKTLRKVRTI